MIDIVVRHSSKVMSLKRTSRRWEALRTRMSILPKRFITPSPIARTAAASAMSARKTSASPPAARISIHDRFGVFARAQRVDRNGCAGRSERDRDGASDILGAAGDKRDLAGELASLGG